MVEIFGGRSVLAAISLLLGKLTRNRAQSLSISSITESHELDDRPPILFLRSFYDDQVGLEAPSLSILGRFLNLMQSKKSLDVLLLEEGTEFGPVVAVGNPMDPIPRYGAARGYFSDGSWQDGVGRLAKESSRIVICIDITDGVEWELEHIARNNYFDKTLFIVHPTNREQPKNRDLCRWLVSRLRHGASASFELNNLQDGDQSVIGFFFDKGRLCSSYSSDFTETSYLLTIRWFLRGELTAAHSVADG